MAVSWTAHFRGGPLDGVMMALQDLPPEFISPVAPPLIVMTNDADVLAPPGKLTYIRLPGVVADEAVYEYKAES